MFAKEGSPQRPFPKLSLAMFAARDSMTILASFNLPPIISEKLQKETGYVDGLFVDCARIFISLLQNDIGKCRRNCAASYSVR